MGTDLQQKVINADGIFEHNFLDSKAFFMYSFGRPPCISFVDQVNTDKVLAYMKKEKGAAIRGVYQYSKFDRKKKTSEFYRTIVVLEDFMIELVGDYCTILHGHEDYDRADELLRIFCRFRKRPRKEPFCINLVSRESYGLELKSMEIKKTKLDLDLYYEDDFSEVDAVIRSRLNKKDDKGIVLLHGLPGAGKTTYLRHLVGVIKKKVLFLSTSAARQIMEPDFMNLLIDNPDSVIVIEDAESLIMDRRVNEGSSVSDLLNVTDGLLADFLHVQIVCTFNHPLSMVDAALMRKGRLIARYEFGKLSVGKAQRLSDHMGFSSKIYRPMTIAEIAGQGEMEFAGVPNVRVVGFRREAEV